MFAQRREPSLNESSASWQVATAETRRVSSASRQVEVTTAVETRRVDLGMASDGLKGDALSSTLGSGERRRRRFSIPMCGRRNLESVDYNPRMLQGYCRASTKKENSATVCTLIKLLQCRFHRQLLTN